MSQEINEALNIKSDEVASSHKGGFFSFEKMISGAIIKILYILGSIAITIIGIALIVNGSRSGYYRSNDILILYGILVIIFGNLFWRILCEAWILFFSLHEIGAKILNELRRKNG